MTEYTPNPAEASSSELADIARERRVKNHNATFERGQQLRARLAVLQEARELRLEEGRRLLAPLERAKHSTPWDLRLSAAYEARRAQNQGQLAGINGEIEQVLRELNAQAPGKGTNIKQWGVPEWAEPGPPREWYPDETHPGGRNFGRPDGR